MALSWNKRLAHGLKIITNEQQALTNTFECESFGYTKSNYGRTSASRETLYCCFEDFIKAFNIVPSGKE